MNPARTQPATTGWGQNKPSPWGQLKLTFPQTVESSATKVAVAIPGAVGQPHPPWGA